MVHRLTEGWMLGRRRRFALLLWLSGLVLDASRLLVRAGLFGPVILPSGFRLSDDLSQGRLTSLAPRARRTTR
jgi:hypothetical protein